MENEINSSSIEEILKMKDNDKISVTLRNKTFDRLLELKEYYMPVNIIKRNNKREIAGFEKRQKEAFFKYCKLYNIDKEEYLELFSIFWSELTTGKVRSVYAWLENWTKGGVYNEENNV